VSRGVCVRNLSFRNEYYKQRDTCSSITTFHLWNMRLAIILETDRLDFDEISLIFYARLRRTHRFASKCRCHSRAWTSRPPGPGKSPWPMIEAVVVLASRPSPRYLSPIAKNRRWIGANARHLPPPSSLSQRSLLRWDPCQGARKNRRRFRTRSHEDLIGDRRPDDRCM